MSPTLTQEAIPQDITLPSAIPAPQPQQDLQSKMIELLMEQNNLLKRICNVFETNGATPIDIRTGSIVFTLKVTSRNRLRQFWKAYQNGTLQEQLQDILITKDLETKAGCSLSVQLKMEEREYQQGLEFFGKQGKLTVYQCYLT